MEIEELLERIEDDARETVLSAYHIADAALQGKIRHDGTPFIQHPLKVAAIAKTEIGLPPECLAAIFLHEAMTQGNTENPDSLLQGFPSDIRDMVTGLNNISRINPKDTRLEAENYKNLIVSYSKDPRVTVLKLADRLEVMRSLDQFPKSSKEKKILETLMLYIPLAHQLGLYNMKSEMEDIYFRFAEPQQYRAITNRLLSTRADRQALTGQFIEPLKETLSAAGISYVLKARTKTAFSIWTKMKKQNVSFDGVYDVFAIRFIIDPEKSRPLTGPDGSVLEGIAFEKALCWKVFSFVTETYTPDTSRLRDWIGQPKKNGYESLHITVSGDSGMPLEVQIRTRRMDEQAESGLASHWSYKGIHSEDKLTTWLKAVRESLEHGGPGLGQDEDMPRPPESDIFVFTPAGELRKLPAGATVLDFAFDIHTGLGCRCTGATVNGKAVSIREQLKTGDVISVLDSRTQKPNKDWLNFVVTGKARTKIRQKLNEEEFRKADDGRELMQRRLKNWKMEITDVEISELMKKWKYPSRGAFFADIAEKKIDMIDVRDAVLAMRTSTFQTDAQQDRARHEWDVREQSGKGSDDILVLNAEGVKGLDYRMAKCCNPVFGDEVFGFVSIKDGVKIHRMSCPNAARLIAMYPYRIQKVRWSDSGSANTFQTTLRITASLENSVLSEITDVVNSFKASVRSMGVTVNQRTGTYEITLKTAVPGNLELMKVISLLKQLKNVIKVSRV